MKRSTVTLGGVLQAMIVKLNDGGLTKLWPCYPVVIIKESK